MYAIAKKEKGSEIDASPQLPISTGVQSLDRSRVPWSVPLDRLPRSAIMAAQVQSTDVFLRYQRPRVSCALCNNFQAARPRQTTERRLAPLYVEHMPSNYTWYDNRIILLMTHINAVKVLRTLREGPNGSR